MHQYGGLLRVLFVRRHLRELRVAGSRSLVGDSGGKSKFDFAIYRVTQAFTAVAQRYNSILMTRVMIDHFDWAFAVDDSVRLSRC
jgi:hypothetical protein